MFAHPRERVNVDVGESNISPLVIILADVGGNLAFRLSLWTWRAWGAVVTHLLCSVPTRCLRMATLHETDQMIILMRVLSVHLIIMRSGGQSFRGRVSFEDPDKCVVKSTFECSLGPHYLTIREFNCRVE